MVPLLNTALSWPASGLLDPVTLKPPGLETPKPCGKIPGDEVPRGEKEAQGHPGASRVGKEAVGRDAWGAESVKRLLGS